jgi:hypothetical protein
MANAIKKKEATNVIEFDPSMFEADASEGLGQLGQDDLAIPFLRILGDTSPQVKKRDPEYVEGAEVGMIFNSLTREIFDGEKGVKVKALALPKIYIHLTRIFYLKQLVMSREKIDYLMVIILKILQIIL